MTMTALFSILGGLGSFIAGIVALIQIVKKNRDSESDEIISVSIVFKISLVVITFVVSYKLLEDFTPTLTSSYCTHILETPDSKYKAIKVGGGNNVHYQVMKVDDNSVVFNTMAEYNTQNDVKSATFSSDSKEFAAAYYYGHDGGYTWIGIWNVKTGNRVRNIKRKGWITELCFVFNDPKK